MSVTATGSADVIVEIIARCRRRMQFVSAVRRAALLIPIAIVIVEVVAIALRPGNAALALAAATACAIAVIAGAIPSIVHGPSMRATAAAIDIRLLLQDRAVTALQLASDTTPTQAEGSSDPMAELVLRDAASRLREISPSRAFPLEAPLRLRETMIASIAATVVFLIATGAPARVWLTGSDAPGGASGAGGGRAGRATTPGPNAKIAEGVTSAAQTASRPSPASAAGSPETPAGRESEPNRSETQARGRSDRAPRSGDLRASGSGRDAGNAAEARDARRGATGFAGRTAAASGGVNGAPDANALPRSNPPMLTAPRDAAYREEYRTASARAEAAIAQERVPARLRAYVKRYFVAIHP